MALRSEGVYQKLVRDIGAIYEEARRAVAKAWWQIGQRIVEVEQGGASRAPFGKGLLQRLARDLTRAYGRGFSVENLRRMRRLYLAGPIQSRATELGVAHQIELLAVRDSRKRQLLAQRALREGLTRDELRALVRHELAKEKGREEPRPVLFPSAKLLTPRRGRPYTCRIVEKGDSLWVDMGFRIYRRLTPARAARFKEGDIVELKPDEEIRKVEGASLRDLYTYEAALDRVYDGDTHWYFIFLDRSPLREMKHDKLRLRGIDCPELRTPAGKAAKRFVEELFSRAVQITVTTTKPDKFDRYLSDVFLKLRDGTEIFLNNELLSRGHARPYDAPRAEDWGD